MFKARVLTKSWHLRASQPLHRDNLPVRHFFSSLKHVETVDVPVRANGHVRLGIHSNPASPRILLWLPSLPLPLRPQLPSFLHSQYGGALNEPAAQPEVLALAADATVITISYRIRPGSQQYPVPVHDVAIAWDWVREHMLSNLHTRGAVGVAGSLIGGSLALQLALTESYVSSSNSIAAVATTDAITDWVLEAATDLLPPPSAKTQQAHADRRAALQAQAASLTALRTLCFPQDRPDAYHDAFASPAHFLRSAARDVPHVPRARAVSIDSELARIGGSMDAADGFAVLEELERGGAAALSEASAPSVAEEFKLDRRRYRRPLRFPPSGSGLVIPRARIAASEAEGLLALQAEEMAGLLKRSVMREAAGGGVGEALLEGEESGGAEALAKAREEAERAVVLSLGDAENMEETGLWLRRALDESLD